MKLKCLVVAAAVCAMPVRAQGVSPETGSPDTVEVKPMSASEIPAQYRADAPKPRKPFAVRFSCPDTGRLYVVFNNAEQTAMLEAGQTTRYLRQVPSADGGRYPISFGSRASAAPLTAKRSVRQTDCVGQV